LYCARYSFKPAFQELKTFTWVIYISHRVIHFHQLVIAAKFLYKSFLSLLSFLQIKKVMKNFLKTFMVNVVEVILIHNTNVQSATVGLSEKDVPGFSTPAIENATGELLNFSFRKQYLYRCRILQC
jgi:hypothetical protein